MATVAHRNFSLSAVILAAAWITSSPASANDGTALRQTLAYLYDHYGLSPAQVAETITARTSSSPEPQLARWRQRNLKVAILGMAAAPTALLENMADTFHAEASDAQITSEICVERVTISAEQQLLPAYNNGDCLARAPDVLIVFDASRGRSKMIIDALRLAWRPYDR